MNTPPNKDNDIVRFFKNLAMWGLLLVFIYVITRPDSGPQVDQPAPNFKGQMLSGETYELADQLGKVVVLDFWATWCPPCLKGLPALQRVYRKYQNRDDVQILAVSIDDTADYRARVARFMGTQRLNFPVLLDATKQIARQYRVKTVPTMVVVNTKGQVSSVQIGLYSSNSDRLVSHIEDAIEQAR